MESLVSNFIYLALWALLSAGTNHTTTFEQPAKTCCHQAAHLQTTQLHQGSGCVTQINRYAPQMNPGRSRDTWQKPDEVVKAMNLQPGQVIADIGAGDGYFTRRFAAAVGSTGKAIGIDIDAGAIRKMTADAKVLGLANYEARLVPEDDAMLAPGSVDIIFLCDAYHHIDGRVAYFTKVKAALKAGGRLIIVDFVKSRDNSDHSIGKEDLLNELQQAGYRLSKESDLLLPRQLFLEFVPAAQAIGETRTSTSEQAAQNNGPAQSLTIKLTDEGYQPSTLKLQRDVLARLTFVRQTNNACGKELLIPEYEIRRTLPVNEPVTIEFTPRKAGEFAFTCGMGHLRGKLIVQ